MRARTRSSIANGGDIVFTGSLQNSGTGDINVTSGGAVTIGGDGG